MRKLLALLLLLPAMSWAECGGTKEEQIACFVADDLATPPTTNQTLLVGDSYIKLYESAATDFAPAYLARRGVSGLRASDLYTYRNELILVHAPRRVFMSIGQNDIHNGASAATVKSSIESIVDAIHAALPATEVVILSIPPSPIRSCQHASPDPDCLTNSYPDEFNEMPIQEDANDLLSAYATATAGVRYVDVTASLFTTYPTLNTSLYSVDELHLKVGGVAYAAWGAILNPIANEALPTGETVVVSRCWTPDGPYVETAQHASRCPPKLTIGPTDTVGTTSYNITVSTDKNSGTIYAYTSTSAIPPSRKALIAGTGAVHHGTITVSAIGAQTRAVTGGTADTQYYTHVRHISTAGRPSNWILIPQRTSASSPPATTTVAGYFWGTDGSDFNAGTSHGTRFASLEPIMELSGVATGTDIWGLAGSVHNVTSKPGDFGDFRTQWGGSAGNPAYIATYYLDGSTPTAAWEGASGLAEMDVSLPGAATLNALGSVTLASINGSLTDACLAAKNCNWQYPIANECSSGSDAIVLTQHNYVHWRAMKIEESSCRGMMVSAPGAANEGDGRLIGIRFRDGIVEQTGTQGIIFYGGVKYSLMHDSIGRFLGECAKSRNSGGTYPTGTSGSLASGGVGCSGGGSAFIYHSSHRAFSGFNNITLFASWTEMLHCLKSSHVLMRYNRGGNVIRGGVYRDVCGDTIVEQNMIWGVNQNVGFGPGTVSASQTWGGSPDSNAEFNQYQSPMSPTNQLFRSNILLGLADCILFNLSGPAVAGGEHTSGKAYHNTCIATRSRSIRAGNNLTAAVNDGVEIQNNVFADPSTTDTPICLPSNETLGNYNLWSKANTQCDGANDINSSAATAALLTLPVGTSASQNATNIAAWRSVSYLSPPDIENARPTAGTHTGRQLNNVQCISDADILEWSNILSDIDDPVSITTATWKMCASEYLDGEAIGNTPVLGALGN